MAVIHTSHVKLPVNGEGAYAFIAQPDDDAKHPGVVLIQEWWGIEPHIRDLAQKLALEGFVVAVPDLFHGKIASEPNDAMRLMMATRKNVDRAVNEIIGALNTVKNMDNVEPKKLGLMGFCFGGFLAYTTAAHYPDLGALVPFYGGGYDPRSEEVARVNAPVFAVYGSQDEGIPPEQIQKIEKLYKDAGKDFTVKVYDAGHAFLNPDHGMGNEAAAADAWPRAINFLKEHLK
ncbi:dienelactone hydrolase family protein [Ktedonobacter racemifer]|jgi:carboxymethylenebutenolidase|uniref:Carboxymethylenebutenolidase n=1 Tax=Ktedonobacter racemifer DSM 44963 TaxID=485913 RepID=D6TLN3_KTERA|nr:dienelactone hydrolase family protein [Ktedonobacter racemifer]EFH86683.1 Carboxymethylenebutenolidase [Ktedonobacter racemifer DSM 44963]